MTEEIFPYAGQLVHLRRKRIKNMYLRVQKPDGHIEISAPLAMKRAQIEAFLRQNTAWVQRKQQALRERAARQALAREYLTGQDLLVWGKPCKLVVRTAKGREASVYRQGERILLTVPDYATAEQRCEIINGWYRRQLEQVIPKLMPRCEAIVGKKAAECRKLSHDISCNLIQGMVLHTSPKAQCLVVGAFVCQSQGSGAAEPVSLIKP